MAITFKNPLTIVQQASDAGYSNGTTTQPTDNKAEQTVEMTTKSES